MEICGRPDEYVRLTPLFGSSGSTATTPTIACSCEMVSHRFAGATEPDEPMVEIEVAELRRFVDELRRLERDRSGTATLASRQIRLSFQVYNRAGHVRLAAELTDHQPDGDHHVALSFKLDPTALPGILSDFEELLAFPGSGRPFAAPYS